jgi:hypothetical protein
MKATIKNNILTIEIDINKALPESKSGKTLVAATTSGFVQTTAEIKGKPVKVSLNAIVAK